MTMAPLYERLAPRLSQDRCRRLLVEHLLVGRAMNRPPAAMPGPYSGGVADGAPFGLSGEVVRGRGAGEHKSTLAAMRHGLETVRRAGHESQVHG
jgi:hypothetical protein